MEARKQRARVFKEGAGWWLARLDDGRVVMCHYRQRDYRFFSQPKVGSLVEGFVEKTERGWRLTSWEEVFDKPEKNALEEQLLAQIAAAERQLHELRRYADFSCEFEAWRRLGMSSGLVPVCPRCGAEVFPAITLIDRASWGGGAEWCATYEWTVVCSCGWHEQFETVRERTTVEEPASPDGYRPTLRCTTETEYVKSKPSLQWRVRHEEAINVLRERLSSLRAELYKIRYGEAKPVP